MSFVLLMRIERKFDYQKFNILLSKVYQTSISRLIELLLNSGSLVAVTAQSIFLRVRYAHGQ